MTKNNTAYHSIVHAHYGCAMAAAYTVLGIPGAVPISNCSPGCIDQQIATMNTCNGFQGTNANNLSVIGIAPRIKNQIEYLGQNTLR